VKQAWSHFNRWRKRHWLLRVLILLIFLAHWAISAPMLPRLVGYATDAILADSEPRVTHAIHRSHKANAVRRLRRVLVAKLDKDDDGTLDDSEREAAAALGLDPDQLRAKPFSYDLDEIVAAAHRADLVPPSYTGRTIRVEALRLARIETETIMAREREKIDALLVWYRVPNYLEWATWKNGIEVLSSYYWYPFGHPLYWIPAFLFLFLTPIVAQVFFDRKKVCLGITFLLLVLTAVALDRYRIWSGLDIHFSWIWNGLDFQFNGYSLEALGQLLVVIALVVSGIRSGRRYERSMEATSCLLVCWGSVLFVWGLVPYLFWSKLDGAILGINFSTTTLLLLASFGVLAIVTGIAITRSPRLVRLMRLPTKAS